MSPLFVYAAPAEGDALQGLPGVDLVRLGVGKAEAAMNLTLALHAGARPFVLAFGVCGAYPPQHGSRWGSLDVGDLCVVDRDGFGDEGVRDELGFRDVAALGLGDGAALVADAALSVAVSERLGGVPRVRGTTVSTCSGTDDLSRQLAQRTDAAVETMEGAAIALVCRRFDVPWAQLRCVSNRTGDRSLAGWDLERAAGKLHAAVRTLVATPLR